MSAIKAGDLVMVVKPAPCCGSTKAIGWTFVVSSIERRPGACLSCNAIVDDDMRAWGLKRWGILVSRLIRIDPPALPESVETEREVTV
jgi:hypothetical protein